MLLLDCINCSFVSVMDGEEYTDEILPKSDVFI